jgi:hypothetical protein
MEFGAFVDQELSELRQRLAEAASEAADAAVQRANAAFQQTVEKLRTDQTQIAGENERLTAEHAALTWEKTGLVEEKATLVGDKAALLEENAALAEEARLNHRGRLLDRLVDVVDRIDHAGSVSDILVAVARGLQDDFARVAIFEVRDQQLEPTGEHGFTPEGAVARISSPVEADTFLAHAARGRSVRVVRPDTNPAFSMQPFGGDPTVLATLPIAVRGGLLALIYADDEGAPCRSGAAEAVLKLAHVLQRHAALRIERLTMELKALAELTAYAKMLVDEVEYVYEADRSTQKPDDQRLTRLHDNLRCARQIFQQRVTVEGPAAESVLDDIVTAAMRSKAGTPFGDDLAIVNAQLAEASHEAPV